MSMFFINHEALVDTLHRGVSHGNIDIAMHDKVMRVPTVPFQTISDKLPGFFGLNPEPHEGR